MTEGNGKTPLLMSSRLGRVCPPQESKDNAGGCNNYSRKVGRSIRRMDHPNQNHHPQEHSTGGFVEEGRPSNHLVEARSQNRH